MRKAAISTPRVGCVHRQRGSVTGRENVDWVYLAPNKDHLWAVINTVMNHPGPQNAKKFVSIREAVSVPRRTVFRGFSYYSVVVIHLGALVGS